MRGQVWSTGQGTQCVLTKREPLLLLQILDAPVNVLPADLCQCYFLHPECPGPAGVPSCSFSAYVRGLIWNPPELTATTS